MKLKMKLKQCLAFLVIEAMAACTIASWMFFTEEDLLKVVMATVMFSPMLAMLPFALLEEAHEEADEDEWEVQDWEIQERPEERRRNFRFYTLSDDSKVI